MTAGVCVVLAVGALATLILWLRHARALRMQWIEIGAASVSWTRTRFIWSELRTEHEHVPLELVRGVNFRHDGDVECVWLLRHDGCDQALTLLHRDWADFAEVLRARLPDALVLDNGKVPEPPQGEKNQAVSPQSEGN